MDLGTYPAIVVVQFTDNTLTKKRYHVMYYGHRSIDFEHSAKAHGLALRLKGWHISEGLMNTLDAFKRSKYYEGQIPYHDKKAA